MPNILLNKFLKDCLVFFLICLFSSGLIIWILQAVNFLDIIIEDGKDYLVYINFSLLNFPKIINRLFPFVFFFSFFYIISKYELNNQLRIFWNFGINKIKIINFFVKFSFLMVLIQIIFSAYLVPASQNQAKKFIRESKTNIYENFIKPKKFIDKIKGLTIFFENRDEDNKLINIYLKKETTNNQYQITYAKSGYFLNKNNSPVLILIDGTTTSSRDGKLSSFKFGQSDFNLENLETNTTTYIKTQEMSSIKLVNCILRLKEIELDFYKYEKKIPNCNKVNFSNILKELTKRFFLTFYIPLLMVLTLFLIIKSKENVNYFNYRILIFLIGIFAIIFSEISIRLLKENMYLNYLIMIMPLILFSIAYLFIISKLRLYKK